MYKLNCCMLFKFLDICFKIFIYRLGIIYYILYMDEYLVVGKYIVMYVM